MSAMREDDKSMYKGGFPALSKAGYVTYAKISRARAGKSPEDIMTVMVIDSRVYIHTLTSSKVKVYEVETRGGAMRYATGIINNQLKVNSAYYEVGWHCIVVLKDKGSTSITVRPQDLIYGTSVSSGTPDAAFEKSGGSISSGNDLVHALDMSHSEDVTAVRGTHVPVEIKPHMDKKSYMNELMNE